MADSNRPGLAFGVQSAQIEIAAGVDGEIAEGRELTGGHVDGETFRDGAQIQRQRPEQRDGSVIRIDVNILVADIVSKSSVAPHCFAGAMFTIETALFHAMAHGRVKRAVGFFGYGQCEPDGFEQNIAYSDGLANVRAELHEFARRVKARAAFFDFVEPAEGTVQSVRRSAAHNFYGHQGAHRDFSADRHKE